MYRPHVFQKDILAVFKISPAVYLQMIKKYLCGLVDLIDLIWLSKSQLCWAKVGFENETQHSDRNVVQFKTYKAAAPRLEVSRKVLHYL